MSEEVKPDVSKEIKNIIANEDKVQPPQQPEAKLLTDEEYGELYKECSEDLIQTLNKHLDKIPDGEQRFVFGINVSVGYLCNVAWSLTAEVKLRKIVFDNIIADMRNWYNQKYNLTTKH